MIVSRVLFAIQAWGGFISVVLINKINAFFRRTKRYRLVERINLFDELLMRADRTLFNNMQSTTHCINQLLPRTKTYSMSLRDRGHFSLSLAVLPCCLNVHFCLDVFLILYSLF